MSAPLTTSLTETTYLILANRYKELRSEPSDDSDEDFPYEIDGYLTEIDTGRIDADYMNSRFEKYLKALGGAEADEALSELCKSFATLTQEEQKYAGIFLRDIQRGDVIPDGSKSFRDYVTEYMERAKNDQIHRLAFAFGLDEAQLRRMMNVGLTESNINCSSWWCCIVPGFLRSSLCSI